MNILALSLFAGINFAFSVVSLFVFRTNTDKKSHIYFSIFSFFSGLYFLLTSIGNYYPLNLGVWIITCAAVYYSAFSWFVLEFVEKKCFALRWIITAIFFSAISVFVLNPTHSPFSTWQIIAHFGLLGLMGVTVYGSIILWKTQKPIALEFSILSLAFIVLGLVEIISHYTGIDVYPSYLNGFLPLDLFPFLFTLVFTRRLTNDILRSYMLKVQLMENQLLEKQLEIEYLEKARLREQLQFSNNDLADFGLEISRVKSFTEEIYDQLLAIKQQNNSKELDEILLFTKSNLQIDKELTQFQKKVDTVNHEFLSNLRKICPDLSKNELQLASLLRLKLNTKEIAAVKNISPDSVKVLRYRMRKKLSLSPEINLSQYISDI